MITNLHKFICLQRVIPRPAIYTTWLWNAVAGLRTVRQNPRHQPWADVICVARTAAPPITTVAIGVETATVYPWNHRATVAFSHSAQVYSKRNKENNESTIEREFSKSLKEHMDTDDYPLAVLEKMQWDQKRKIYAIKRARAARDFKDAPEKRTLSWNTIDQIRYLRQENPDEWSVATLSRSFDVSEEVIAKVLKSKFTPSNKDRQKQDMRVAMNTDRLMGGEQTQKSADVENNILRIEGKITKNQTMNGRRPRVNSDAKTKHQHLHNFDDANREVPPGQYSGKTKTKIEAPKTATNRETSTGYANERPGAGNTGRQNSDSHFSNNHGKADDPVLSEKCFQNKTTRQQFIKDTSTAATTNNSLSPDRGGEEEELDIEFTFGKFDFENVDSLMGQVKLKPQIIRKGRNFYNENGEFLYRI